MQLHFGARLKLKLDDEEMTSLFKKEVSDDGNAAIIQDDVTNDYFLVVNTDNGPEKTLTDKEDVFQQLDDLVGLEDKKAEKVKKLETIKTPIEEELKEIIRRKTQELFAPYRHDDYYWESDFEAEAKGSPEVIAIQDKLNSEAEKVVSEFKPVIKQLENTLSTLKAWVNKEFRENDDLYRDRNPF